MQNEIDTSTLTFRRGLFCDTSERLCRGARFSAEPQDCNTNSQK
ncbi:hypothetical protein GHU52_20365 [Citrobacter cronae]|nr:hypothetical protein [Citrobacter cronae]MBJ8397771.1 hypothetical protein [Citrobacter cronae]MBJ8411536.1 hypothetical protein [Citrobacter cronae]